ncbi:MAG: response regulator [Deltaproteobacteria bacterium]|nr:MAG: response regulator [Deltaproteobacteria bacterium]
MNGEERQVEKEPKKRTPVEQELHKLNNALGAVLGFSNLLQRHLRDDDIGSEYVTKIGTAIREALRHAELLERAVQTSDSLGPAHLTSSSTSPERSLEAQATTQESSGVAPSAAESSELPDWGPLGGCESLLIVEDAQDFLNLLSTFFSHLGYDVTLASDGRSAIQMFEQDPRRFDLVVLDRDLPHVDGVRVAQEMRSIRPKVRLMLLSGSNLDESDSPADMMDFQAVLRKPIPLSELGKQVRRVLDQ